MRRLIVTFAAAGLLVFAGAVAAQERPGAGAGRFEVAGFPAGAMFFSGSSDQQEPEFGTFALGAALTYNVNRFVGVEGEFGNAVGLRQRMTFQNQTLNNQHAPCLYSYTGEVVVNPLGQRPDVRPLCVRGPWVE